MTDGDEGRADAIAELAVQIYRLHEIVIANDR